MLKNMKEQFQCLLVLSDIYKLREVIKLLEKRFSSQRHSFGRFSAL